MTIFLAGATGAIGKRLVPRLIAAGHRVVGTTRSAQKMQALKAHGAEPVVVDGLDREAVMRAVAAARPDVIVHQMTALATLRNLKRFDAEFAATNRLRTEGTDHLLEAAHAAGVARIVVQSYAGWPSIRQGGRIKTEDDPLDPNPPAAMKNTLEAIRHIESTVPAARGIIGVVLRYGALYGPGTSIAADGESVVMVRKRMFPVVGGGTGVWSFAHVDDVAAATHAAIENGPSGIFNVVDDEPAEVSLWLPELARAVGAKPPRHLPSWLGRLVIGDAGVAMMTTARGSSNAKAKRTFGWQPRYATWRDGFRRGLSAAAAADARR